jgi:integrase
MRGSLIKAKTKRVLPKGQHTWRIIVPLGRGADSKYKQKWVTFRGSRKQAEQKLRDLTTEVHHGEFIEPSKVTVGAWLDEWLAKAIKPRRAANTYSGYSVVVNKHLKPALGHLTLQGLTPLHVEGYYSNLKVSSNTASVHRAILTCALKAAVNAGMVRSNVAQRATNKPRAGVPGGVHDNVWTAEEAQRFLAAVDDVQYKTLFALALDSGCRRNELLGLQWQDVQGAVLKVERQLVQGGDAPTFALPKRGRVRQMDLSDETLTLLSQHKREQSELKMKNRTWYRDHGLMFAQTWGSASGLGASLPESTVNLRLTAWCKAAGVRRITVHGLRHTCATLLLSAGVSPHVVQRRLGHAKVEMTLNIYAHVLPDMQSDAAKRLAALLHG